MKIRFSLTPFRQMVITGCKASGTQGVAYMTRTYLLDKPAFQLCVHHFHRSDQPHDFHDHPWWFLTLVLWRGYTEHVLREGTVADVKTSRRVRPGQIVFRRATFMHRVELLGGKPALTLCLMGRKSRTWGFKRVGGKWIPFHQYFKDKGC